jgi:hypothetical protein
MISGILAISVLLVSGMTLAQDHRLAVIVSGLAGLLAYLATNGLAGFFENTSDPEDEELSGISGSSSKASGKLVVGKAAFSLFLYLEVLDASFSFDGVVGAFALSNQIFVIATGLGIGAMFIRSATVYLVEKGTLAEYRYLEHGAHYAILALAVMLFLGLHLSIPDWVTGLSGVVLIGLALISSIRANRQEPVLV